MKQISILLSWKLFDPSELYETNFHISVALIDCIKAAYFGFDILLAYLKRSLIYYILLYGRRLCKHYIHLFKMCLLLCLIY